LDSEAKTFFCASSGLRSDVPSARLPAIEQLMILARNASPPIRARAVAILVKEFGPYAVTHGLSGCAGPIAEVECCSLETRDCRDCPWAWAWLPQQDETLPDAVRG
jgi:hypothetical protein